MTRRYSSISVQTALATSISNTALSAVVSTGTASTLLGGISLTAGDVDQFKVIFDPDTASAEIMYVTGVTSDTLTIARGKDGTSAVSHTGGAVIKHVLTGEDLTYFTTGVVPTSDLATGLPFPGSTSGTNTLKAPAVAGTVTTTLPAATGTLATLAGTETFTNKTLTSPTITTPTVSGLTLSDASIILEGATADAFETTLTVTDPTADRTITLPDSTGTVALTSGVMNNTLLTTTGDTPYASSANTPARLAVGTTGQVLTVAAGLPSWATPTGGGLALIKRASFSGVANTGTTFDDVFSSTYREYLIKFESMSAATPADDLYMQMRYAGPTTYSGNFYQWQNLLSASSTVAGTSATSVSQFQLSATTGDSARPSSGLLWVSKVGNASEKPVIQGSYYDPNSLDSRNNYGYLEASNTYLGFILSSSSSNITGTISVYGLAVA